MGYFDVFFLLKKSNITVEHTVEFYRKFCVFYHDMYRSLHKFGPEG